MENKKHDWHDVMPHYRLFDDALMMACFDDAATVQEVLRIILGRPFTVTEVKVQEKVPPSQWHGAVFDVTALDENGNKCDIEIQREDTGDLVKRAEFYSCLLGRMALNTSEDYITMRETFVIRGSGASPRQNRIRKKMSSSMEYQCIMWSGTLWRQASHSMAGNT